MSIVDPRLILSMDNTSNLVRVSIKETLPNQKCGPSSLRIVSLNSET